MIKDHNNLGIHLYFYNISNKDIFALKHTADHRKV